MELLRVQTGINAPPRPSPMAFTRFRKGGGGMSVSAGIPKQMKKCSPRSPGFLRNAGLLLGASAGRCSAEQRREQGPPYVDPDFRK